MQHRMNSWNFFFTILLLFLLQAACQPSNIASRLSDNRSQGSCQEGFKLDNNGTCVDIDECQSLLTMNTDGTLVPEEDRRDVCGNYVHSHRPGFRCVNTPGSYRCLRIVGCGFGYVLNETLGECVDIDECAELGYEVACGLQQPIKVCINLEGTFRCDYRSCPSGRHLDRSTGECRPCRRGYEKNKEGRCVDINECRRTTSSGGLSACQPHMRCLNYAGGYECKHKIFCTMGRRANYNGTRCVDIDECVEQPRICGVGRNCINLDGSYRCESKQCGRLQELNQQTGECVCTEGFRMNETARFCEDINECTEDRHNCEPGDVCRNTRGHFDCLSRDKVCEPGFGLSFDHSSCVDIDECKLGHYKCKQHEYCNNTHGSYTCLCKSGFHRIGSSKECIDIDECSAVVSGSPPLCPEPMVCRNTPGAYACDCPRGHRRRNSSFRSNNSTSTSSSVEVVGTSPCVEIDECSEQPNTCWPGECSNWPAGSYTCSCPAGYMATKTVGGACADIDECQLNACPQVATCRNTPGGYDCLCRSGFRFAREANQCEDIDECQQDNATCTAGLQCFNYGAATPATGTPALKAFNAKSVH